MHPKFEDIFGKPHDLSISSEYEPKSVLITGAKGMLGNGLAQTFRFLQDIGKLPNTKLFLLSRDWHPKEQELWHENKNCILIPNSSMSSINFPIEIVIHTASPSNITQISSYNDLYEANIGLLKGIQKLKPSRIVYISTGEVYKGESLPEGSHSKNLSKTFKRDWYPIVKLNAEFELRHNSLKNNFSTNIVRLFHTFGPGVKRNDGRSFADILWSASLFKEIILKSNGNQIRSFLYLSDAIEAIIKMALTNEPGCKIVNVGSDRPISILEFSKIVSTVTRSSISFDLQNDFPHSSNEFLVPVIGDINNYNWSPKVDILDGIMSTVHWIKSLPHY